MSRGSAATPRSASAARKPLLAVGRIGEARAAIDQRDALVAEIEQVVGGVAEGALVVDVEPGVGQPR